MKLRAGFTATLRLARSLPGKLLGLSVLFVLVAEVLIFFPSAANFRTEYLLDRVDAAYIAALSADVAADAGEGAMLSEDTMRELLAGADAVSVARITDGVNELVLGGFAPGTQTLTARLDDETFWDRLVATCHTFFATPDRHINIIAKARVADPTIEPPIMSVLVPEAGLRDGLLTFSRNILGLSLFIAAVTGGLLYVFLLFMLVRPMRRLARAMTAFKDDPSDRSRTIEVSRRSDEIGEAEAALSAMQSDVRAAFAQRERLAALGGAVARINHDLRNVLASAQLVSDRLAMSKDERVSAMGARLLRAVDRGIRLCQDTLDYGKSSERAPEKLRIGLRNALDDAAGDAFAATGAAEWINEVDENLIVLADPDHVHRIFLNLIRNSVQAMAKSDQAQLSVSAVQDGDLVSLTLNDTGPGVPDRIKETLFQPFGLSGSNAGSGLGLSIARELARAMGGDVSLKSTGPEGTAFQITLTTA